MADDRTDTLVSKEEGGNGEVIWAIRPGTVAAAIATTGAQVTLSTLAKRRFTRR